MSGFPAEGGMPAAQDYMKRIEGIDISKPAYFKSKPGGIMLDPSQLDLTVPEMKPGPYLPGQDLRRDKYIQFNPGSGISMLPGGEQGPAQGPNIPIKNYGGQYMPDGTQPSGYRPGPYPLPVLPRA